MSVFRYAARDASGTLVRGTLQADNRSRALDNLWQTGLTVVDLKEQTARESIFSLRRGKQMMRPNSLALLCHQLAAMLDAGVGAIESLQTLARQSGDPQMTTAMDEVIESLQDGHSMADSFRRAEVFPSLFYRMVSAGEASGSLEVTLEDLAAHYDREVWLDQKIRSTLIYPKAVLGVASIVVVFIVVYVFPFFVELFFTFDMELPLPTLIVLNTADFASRYWMILLPLAVGLYIGWLRLLKVHEFRLWWDRVYLKMPALGELQWKILLNQTTSTLATLLRSGLPLLESLDVLEDAVDNRYLAKAMGEMKVFLQAGLSLSEAFARDPVFTPILIRMVAVGEESGRLDEMLGRVAKFYHREVEAITERLTQMLEPLIVVSMGIVVGFLLIAIYLPMFDAFRGVG